MAVLHRLQEEGEGMSGFTSGMRSSSSGEWTTPHDLFAELDAEFHFDVDAASTDENALCERHFTAADDGLAQEWSGTVWCNPPYGRQIGKWMRKAAESNGGGSLYASFPRGRTRHGGTTGLSATPRRSGSYGGGSSSAIRGAARRSRLQSSCTTSARRDGGQPDRRRQCVAL